MALHFGEEKMKLRINNTAYVIHLFAKGIGVKDGVVLSDLYGLVLYDSNGLYLVAKED